MRIHPHLPIYYLPNLTLPVLYSPGTLAVVEQEHAELIRQFWRTDPALPDDPRILPQMQWLVDHAKRKVATRLLWLEEAYTPECLTVYLSNRCNLTCSYCYAAKERGEEAFPRDSPLIDMDCFTTAAELVSKNCRQKHKPFQLVLHGGGEPTLHWDLLQQMVNCSKAIASSYGLEWTGYIATNGVLPLERAQWLGANFQRVGLSCDGPPDIQNRQRPLGTHGASSDWVCQTAKAIRLHGAHLEIRATITEDTVDRQREIVLFLVHALGAKTIRFEPAYGCDVQPDVPRNSPYPEYWAQQFWEAREAALALGAHLDFSGIRLDEIHGPYCNPLRQVLHLTPDGKATACFLCIDGNQPQNANRIIGQCDSDRKQFILESRKIDALRKKAASFSPACRACFAAFHCARSCPDVCILTPQPPGDALKQSFRCRLNKAIGQRLIEEAATELLIEEQSSYAGNQGATIPAAMEDVLAVVPVEIGNAVIDDWKALGDGYHVENRGLPSPLWEEKGFELNGEETWRQLNTIISGSPQSPISIYVHIPFCDKRCGFCDCYALNISPQHQLQDRYTGFLLGEIGKWAGLSDLTARPVTTVHFGGGTPNSMAEKNFDAIVTALSQYFKTVGATEWALESTAHHLDDQQLARLWSQGFRRLHIGVQTLEEPLRQKIGRRETAQKVVQGIQTCLAQGFITTVDLIYGLPGESPAGFFKGIEHLIGLGIHGISFYRFNRSARNRRFVAAHADQDQDSMRDYAMFMASDQLMLRAGYRKNHFCHYALPEDTNLYYTHARRGEDLLALGASADGVFGRLHYRNPNLTGSAFLRQQPFPLLQGGVLETDKERQMAQVVAQLMTGSLHRGMALEIGLSRQVERWLACRLLEADDQQGSFRLTGNGSWLIRQLLDDVCLSDPVANNMKPMDL